MLEAGKQESSGRDRLKDVERLIEPTHGGTTTCGPPERVVSLP
jgi:hypothetical protein